MLAAQLPTTNHTTHRTAKSSRVGQTLRQAGCFLLLSAALSLGQAQAAPTYDAAADFSLATNPNGAWAYGYSTTLTGALILHTESLNASGLDVWRTNIGSNDPTVYKNNTANTVTASTIQIEAGRMALHPGPNNEFEKVRLTVGAAGDYDVNGAFWGVDVIGTSTDVHVLLNGVAYFDDVVNGFGAGSTTQFSSLISLAVNDTLDFVVGFGLGPNAHYFNDSTGFSVTVTPRAGNTVAEPTSAALAGLAGLGLMAVATRRRRGGAAPRGQA